MVLIVATYDFEYYPRESFLASRFKGIVPTYEVWMIGCGMPEKLFP